ncbi:hypothetical protein BJ875DRAFT_357084, partial [Amylocarpus encephaloides]
KFSFNSPIPLAHPTNRPYKRRRALSDVDGDGNEGRKKRRLRLHLITSRLSRPFSQPATNIVNRGVAKVAVLGSKNKALGRSELRKAAIMNRVRKRMDAAKDYIRLEQERGRAALSLREIVLQKPRIHEMPLPPSPLGLSNYDALDLEEAFEHFEDDGMNEMSAIYSDFNIMNPISSDGDDYDYLDAIDGIQTQDMPDTPPQPVEEDIIEMLREKECEGESVFVRV